MHIVCFVLDLCANSLAVLSDLRMLCSCACQFGCMPGFVTTCRLLPVKGGAWWFKGASSEQKIMLGASAVGLCRQRWAIKCSFHVMRDFVVVWLGMIG